MKKILILTLLMSFGLFSMAQTKFQVKNNLKEAKSLMIKSSDQVSDDYSSHPYLKPVNHSNNGTDDITVIDIGEAGNAWGLCSGARTYIWVDNDINSIAFSHRMLNPPGGPGTGYIAYDFSIDGGETWEVNNQVYEALTADFNGRYPQCVIYNPEGNTDPALAFFSYFIPVLDATNGDTWGGYAWGGNFLTTIPPVPTQTNLSSRPGDGIYQAVPDALHITPNGNTFVVEPSLIDGFFTGYTGELIFTNGVFNAGINDYEYTQTLFEAPITSDPVDCTVTSQRIAFSPDGQIGYVGLLTNNGDNTEESYGCYYPVLYKSTNGGETWDDEAINVQLGGPDGLEAVLNYMSDETLEQIYEPPIPPRDEIPFTTAFNLDLVVDAYGNPHIITVVGIGSQAWSIYTSATGEPCNGWIAMLHIYTTDDETWMCDTLTTPNTFRGDFGADLSEDTRPQISITPDGKKLFFSWIDTDQPTVVDNIYPDIYCVGYDVDHDVYTSEDGNYKLWNVTTMTAAWMSTYMATQSYYVFDNDNSWEIPFVYQEMDINDPLQPVQYKYIKDFVITSDDFEIVSDEQTIDVEPGFQFVSSHINPDIPDMMEVATEIINDDLVYIRNSTGAMLRKIGPNWINGIGDWIGTEGYLIKTSAVGEFTVTGSITPANTPISIIAGFQFVSYLPETEMDALEAFATIIGDDLVYVRNSVGAMLRKIGPNWVNGIGDCIPTEGYLIKMAADAELVYPTDGAPANVTSVEKGEGHFNFEGGDPSAPLWTIYIGGADLSIVDYDLEAGDEIAIFDGELLVGVIILDQVCTPDNQFENFIVAFTELVSGSGYVAGNPFTFVAWDQSEDLESTSFIYEFTDPYGDAYVGDVFPEETAASPYSIATFTFTPPVGIDENAINVAIYPNPANDILNINSNTLVSNVKVMNYIGQTIDNINVNGMNATINTSTYNAGIYFIQIETEEGISTQKIIIE